MVDADGELLLIEAGHVMNSVEDFARYPAGCLSCATMGLSNQCGEPVLAPERPRPPFAARLRETKREPFEIISGQDRFVGKLLSSRGARQIGDFP